MKKAIKNKNKYKARVSNFTSSDTRAKFKSRIAWKEANPNESIIGDVTNPHVLNNVFNLVGKIIQGGIKNEGVEYFNCNDSQYWLQITNLDLSFIKNKVTRV